MAIEKNLIIQFNKLNFSLKNKLENEKNNKWNENLITERSNMLSSVA